MFPSNRKDEITAQSLQKTLQIGSYTTAWAMIHPLRSVLVRPIRVRLFGIVEVDETYIGGEESGLKGGRAKGKKAVMGVAVEDTDPRGIWPLSHGDSARRDHHINALLGHREHRARVPSHHHRRLARLPQLCVEMLGYTHVIRSLRPVAARGGDPGKLLPGVHRVASLVN